MKWISNCKDNHLVNKGTYSNKANRRSVDPVIVEIIQQVEIFMITRRILVQSNNDETACFHRIMPHILCLYLWSYQIPAKFTALLD